MSEDVLLRFLSNGLIDVGGDDAKLDKLRATASDLAGELMTTPAKAASFALVAFDPQAPAADPVVKEAVEALRKRWATYMNTFSGTPVAVVRAMLLDALDQAAAADDRIGVAFVTSARNALPFMEVGEEKTIWADVIGKIEGSLDVRAEREWATPGSIVVPPMSFQASATQSAKLEPIKAKRDAFAAKIQAAAGPAPSTGGNQNWPKQDQPWVTEFGKWMAEAVADFVEVVVSQTKVSGTDVTEPLRELSKAVTTYAEGTLRVVSSATAGLQRRTNLIWWKQALYSPSARTGYRDLAPEAAAALMALDLHRQVPTFSPASVSAFLYEAVLAIPLAGPKRSYPIRDLVVGSGIGRSAGRCSP